MHEPTRKHGRLIVIVAAAAAVAATLVPGSAVAAPGADGFYWTYPGLAPSSEQSVRFRYHDSSPLQYAALEVNNSTPATYQWSKITVKIDDSPGGVGPGVPAPSVTAFPLTGAVGGIGLRFPSGLVTDGTYVTVSSDTNPTIPKNTGGELFLQDSNNQGMRFALNGAPIPAKTIGQPRIWAAHIKGVQNGKPILTFRASRGRYAPDLTYVSATSVDVSYYTSSATTISASPLLNCTAKKAHHKLACKAKRPVSGATVTIKYPHLIVSKSLQRAVRLGRLNHVPFLFTIKDAHGHQTRERVGIAIGP